MRLITPRLLIADDDRDFRETVAGLLTDRGFDTVQAGDGEEALGIVGQQEVHLLLLDMQMPRMTGLEAIEQLRERKLILPLPWILISGALDEATIARAQSAAVFSVLRKPLRLAELTGAVTSALQQAYDWRAA